MAYNISNFGITGLPQLQMQQRRGGGGITMKDLQRFMQNLQNAQQPWQSSASNALIGPPPRGAYLDPSRPLLGIDDPGGTPGIGTPNYVSGAAPGVTGAGALLGPPPVDVGSGAAGAAGAVPPLTDDELDSL
jgi:hypothetical protein